MSARIESYALLGDGDAIHADVCAEEYAPADGRQLGNFPQAFSHVGLVNSAFTLTPPRATPAAERKDA